eukprot:6040772-Prymnesium_polylepis.2
MASARPHIVISHAWRLQITAGAIGLDQSGRDGDTSGGKNEAMPFVSSQHVASDCWCDTFSCDGRRDGGGHDCRRRAGTAVNSFVISFLPDTRARA